MKTHERKANPAFLDSVRDCLSRVADCYLNQGDFLPSGLNALARFSLTSDVVHAVINLSSVYTGYIKYYFEKSGDM